MQKTVANNIKILRDLFQEQLGLVREYFKVQQPAIFIGGNNLTLLRMMSAQYSVGDNTSPYDKLLHVMPTPGLFHVFMHTVVAIINSSWGAKYNDPSDPPDSGCNC
jgi:hypothetical protein